MDAPYVLAMAGQTAWTPLSLPSLFAHFDLSEKTVVFDEGQGRNELDAWPDQSGSGVIAIPITYPDDGLTGAILRPKYVEDAGDGRPGIDGRDTGIGRGLRAPYSATELDYFHNASGSWTLLTSLYIPVGETLPVIILSTGGYTGSNAGFTFWAAYFAGGYKLTLSFADGATSVNVLETVVSPPQNSHVALVCTPLDASPLKLYLNGVEADEWTGALPSAAGAGPGLGLCFGNWARDGAYYGSAWVAGRFATLCKSALSESQIAAHANWSSAAGYV